MKRILITLLIAGVSLRAFGQGYERFEVSLMYHDKIQKGVRYFSISNDTAKAIKCIGDSLLLIETTRLKTKPLKFMAIYKNDEIVFKVPSSDFFYIKVEHLDRFAGSNQYLVRLGLEDDLIVKVSKRKYVIIK